MPAGHKRCSESTVLPYEMSTARHRWALWALAAAAGLGAVLSSSTARAESSLHLSVDWRKLEAVLREGPAAFLPQPMETPASQAAGEPRADRNDMKWFGLSPHVSLIARDWGGAQLLVGHLALTDRLRLSRSSRMFVSRVRLADGRFAPFAHVGLGQWRVDTDLMPVLPRDVELAAQYGFGFELAILRRVTLAIEGDHTILIRDQHEPQMVTAPNLFGAFVGARAIF